MVYLMSSGSMCWQKKAQDGVARALDSDSMAIPSALGPTNSLQVDPSCSALSGTHLLPLPYTPAAVSQLLSQSAHALEYRVALVQ